MKNILSHSLVIFIILFLSSCGNKEETQAEINQTSTEVEQSPEETGASAQIMSTKSASQHFIEIIFDQAIATDSFDIEDISIVSGTGQKLTVSKLSFYDDGTGVVLETAPQDPVLYTIQIGGKDPTATSISAKSSNSQLTAATDNNTFTDADNFIGSTGPEPFVMYVTALSNTTVLVTMDRKMDEGYANLTSAYRVLAPNNEVPNVEEGRIEVLKAEVDKTDKRLITLTTSPMSNIEYVLEVTNIITEPGQALIHPDRNGGYFFGIAEHDETAPLLLSALSTSNTTMVASFSEPLWGNAAEPFHYQICAIAFDEQGACSEVNQLGVISTEMVGKNTQVSFITQPQASGVTYYLSVNDITDRATPAPGNVIAEQTVAQFTGSGLDNPNIASSIAMDNTHVLVTFTERMDDDALVFANYRIEDPELDVINAIWGDDQNHVILTTSPQQRIEYQLIASNIHSAEGLLMVNPPEASFFVGFDDKDLQKPFLIASIAETSSRIRLYFSEPMDVIAATPNLYAITFCPEFQTCNLSTLSTIPVLSAELVESNTQVMLTVENIAPRVTHQVVVSSQVTDQAMPLPHNGMDPDLSTGSFGLLLADKDAPSLVNIIFTSTNNITLTFSEEINSGGANPLNYRVCAMEFENDGSCTSGNIQVVDASLNPTHTQVELTLETLVDGTTYYVLVLDGVTDTSGNIIANDANSVSAFYQGATSVSDPTKLPQVVGAISTGNTNVTLSYSSVMGDSALLPSNYLFTQENINGEVGTVFSMNVVWFDSTHTSVNITTTSQNEVTYRVTVVNVKDKQGNPLATQESTFNPNFDPRSSVFAGSPPVAQNLLLAEGNYQIIENNENDIVDAGDIIIINGTSLVLVDIDLDGIVDNWDDTNGNGIIDSGDLISGLVDSDGDGLADNEELRGTTVVINLSNGEKNIRQVTSDPTTNDTDKDGLTDSEEWAFGLDPRSPDTDADGLGDYVEWNVVYSGPADQDTDEDGLPDGVEHNFFLTSPLLADTDGDQFSDEEELISLNRDPKVADMPELDIEVDGINLQIDERYTYVNSEGETVSSESSTSASLSSSENTSFANSTLTFRENTSSFSWDVGFGLRDAQADHSAVNGAEVACWACYLTSLFDRLFIEVGLGGTTESHTGTNTQIDTESAREAQQALENSLIKFNEQAKDQEVTRELTAARISANITVQNKGDVAFTVKNLEISVLQVDPQNPSRYLPIATLIADSTLMTGNDLEINIGPFDGSKGPFVFANNEVYPAVIETLMRDPKSLVFKVVNYDIADEYERNFAFSSQTVHDRTAGISFDFGELGSENYQVATNGVLDNNIYLGGFDGSGKNKGLPLGYLLENLLGLDKHDTSEDYIDAGPDGILSTIAVGDDVLNGNIITAGQDGILTTKVAIGDLLRNNSVNTGIIAGVNKKVDTLAQGDDVQLIPYGASGIAPRTLVIDPGNNGVLDSIQSDGDEQEFISGYELQRTCSVASAKAQIAGQYCSVDTIDCSCDGPKGLVRVKTFRNGDYGANWFARVEGDMPTSVDFDQIELKAGQSIRLAFLQDLDKDGLFAHEEYLFGSVDSAVDNYNNDDFVPTVINNRYLKKTLEELEYFISDENQTSDPAVYGDGLPDSMDSDRDGISDLVEAKLGWLISANGELKRVFSSPATPDSDNDGLWDIQEQDLREFCKEDDTRSDALCIDQTIAKEDASAIIVGKNGKLDTEILADDVYTFIDITDPESTRFNRNLMFATVGILPGNNGVIDTDIAGDDEYSNSTVILPATDPLLSDTDNDRVSDGDELFGFAAGMAIIETAETECYDPSIINGAMSCVNSNATWGIVNTVAQGDDIQRISLGSRTKEDDVIITAGLNGILETEPQGDDETVIDWFIAAGPDRELNSIILSEYNYPENPVDGTNVVVYKAENATLAPYAPAVWNSSGQPISIAVENYVEPWLPVPEGKDVKLYGRVVTTDPLRRDSDNDAIPDGFEVAIGADPTKNDGDSFRDSDFDGLSDAHEARGWIVSIDMSTVGVLVRPNSVLADSDYDGLPDYVERDIGSDPNSIDTDGDGIDDYQEFRSITHTSINGEEYSFSVYDYANIESSFSGFNLVINPDAYGTNPLLKDSDEDGLSDHDEVITGYTVTLTGELNAGTIIYTNPLKADSDGDGLSDYEEANNFNGYITNANDVDTDGDGTDDKSEVDNSLINPLQRDALVHVSYESLYLGYMGEGECALNPLDECEQQTNILWWLYGDGNDGEERGNRILSSSDEFAYTPDGTVRPLASGHQQLVNETVVPAEDIPESTDSTSGLLMEVSYCAGSPEFDATVCDEYLPLNPGERGYNARAHVDWGTGGPPQASNDFKVKWSGEIFLGEGLKSFTRTDDNGDIILDPESGTPLLDPDTGEPILDPDTGEPIIDPSTMTAKIFYEDATYSLHITSDDGFRMTVSGQGVEWPGVNTEWSLNANQNRSFDLTVSEPGWKTIEIEYFEHLGYARLLLNWQPPSFDVNGNLVITDPVPVPIDNLRHTLGNGSYACVGIERDPTQTSFVSLNRAIEMDNSISPNSSYAPGLSYYGSMKGSEMKIFKDAVSLDVIQGDQQDPTSAMYRPYSDAHSRYYIDFDVNEIKSIEGVSLTAKDLMSVAVDLAASRHIINGLVKPSVTNNSIVESAVIKTDEYGKRYFDLSSEGRMLYRQLSQDSGVYGQQTFVLHEGENINLSGVLMRVDDIESLTSCPIGSANVVSQFQSGCMKRFSRSISYAEVTSQSYMTFDLKELGAMTTSASNDPAGCEIELEVTVSH
ncbi:Ig-like domain-containing protein [Thalassotalea sp. ND16A]|uniref:Ig-like domain-containing protein n=1 Tax=Thalassotalea sp. ND16A TaxID=1535422 RepID=UPI00051A106C|nr:Ig-like domain-containing protein [Thalassotalea sp. ND16A]KGJ89263.1 hypothetical protein ND16A_2156 [Thalassotalea sp. ND16A]